MTDVLNEIVNDPEMIIMTDEEDDDVLNEMVAEREPVDPEDVFEKKHQVKESTGPTVEPIKKKDKPVKLTKSGKVRKQMSPEALARLEAGRKKALAARKEKAEIKRKEKEEQLKLRQLEIQAEQVKREKKKKELKKVINGEDSDDAEPKPKPSPTPAPQPLPTVPPQSVSVNAKIDEDVIQKAIQEALEKNEMMRQKRKAEKKAKISEEIEKAKAAEKIKQAIYPPDRKYFGDEGFWSKSVFFTQ